MEISLPSSICSLHTHRSSFPKLGLITFSHLRPPYQPSSSPTTQLQESDEEIILETNKKKKKKKPRPGFLDVTMQKWSVRNPSQRVILPWQESRSFYDEMKKFGLTLDSEDIQEQQDAASVHSLIVDTATDEPLLLKNSGSVDQVGDFVQIIDECDDIKGTHNLSFHKMKANTDIEGTHKNWMEKFDEYEDMEATHNANGQNKKTVVQKIVEKMKEMGGSGREGSSRPHLALEENSAIGAVPWETSEDERRRRKTELAESVVPEPELQRLRNLALRMKERIKVQDGGVTKEIVDLINERWKDSEVVKIKFEGAPVYNMKRTHQILERKTGGLVIWRSGSSVVLYRGMSYELPCVQSYKKQSQTNSSTNSETNLDIVLKADDSLVSEIINREVNATDRDTNSICPHPVNVFGTTSRESTGERSIDSILNELGPQFNDWSGCHPLPVDADLLPSVVPDYKPPFRVLPHKMKHCVGNKEMTSLRRLARTVSPHFALGRNRQLQGLATAIVKLWEKSAIAKIAIKRGIQNTRNEIMAEEIKKLTGGTLVSRNKEYIVFYRGNDFLPPAVAERLSEREKLAALQYEEEDKERLKASASVVPKFSTAKGPYLAGTLAETLEANSRWGREPSAEEKEAMIKDAALAKQASLIEYLERKLAYARRKVNKAERALAKIQEVLSPAKLPYDQEIITDEERSMFRKIGLNMQSFLVLGRRGVFDGIVENMHLHWKHRELVKIIVKGKSLLLVKHIAISLEAESGGVLISLDKTTKGYAVIFYRGKNYKRPSKIRPTNLLTRRKALTHSIELQRREALNHHILDLRQRIKLLRSELEHMKAGKEKDAEQLYAKFDEELPSEDYSEDEDEEVYPWTVRGGLDEEQVT